MKSKQPPIRLAGQRLIPSSFLLGSSNRSQDSKEGVDTKAPEKKNLRASLSDFLDRKLQQSSDSPKAVKGKAKPFLSPVGRAGVSGLNDVHVEVGGGGSKNMNDVLEQLVFEKFKPGKKDNGHCKSKHGVYVDQVGSHVALESDELKSRKRRNPFEGGSERNIVTVLGDNPKPKKRFGEERYTSTTKLKPQYDHCGDDKLSVQNHVVVLGDDPKPKRRFGEERFGSNNNKRKPLYNHYANGSGWWDCNMEGVDNEEVGCSEIWEGVGTTTLGGLDWH